MNIKSSEVFKDSMARFTSSVSAITTAENGQPCGVLATSVCSLSAEPPTILVCINKNASVHDVIMRSRTFAVNVLSGRQADVATRFGSEKGAARFDPGAWAFSVVGTPILIQSVVSLECNLIATHHGYSHTILIGEIVESLLHDNAEICPLLWHQRGFASPALTVCGPEASGVR